MTLSLGDKDSYKAVPNGHGRDDPEAKDGKENGHVSNGYVQSYEPVETEDGSEKLGWVMLAQKENQLGAEPVQEPEGKPKREVWTKELEFVLAAIGNAVGLGNLWRFPYLCYISGGGAFLIPYFIMLVVCGIPLLYMELSTGQFTQRGPAGALRQFSPFFQGVGMATVVLSFLFCTYYGVIMCWAMFYMGASVKNPLPWSDCNNTWNTELCWDGTLNVTQPNDTVAPTQEYFELRVLQQSSGIDEPDGIVGYLAGTLLLGWILVYLCLFRGVAWTGKIVYFTVTFPYVVLIALIARGCTLPGAQDGIDFFIKPDWELLLQPTVWVNAAAQNFNSIGIAFGSMITFSSYNKKSTPILRNVLTICLVDACTAIMAGFAVFSILGNIAYIQGKPVDEVVTEGVGLVFIVYPQAFVTMPYGVAQAFAFLFFFMLICLAIDSLFASVEVVLTHVEDQLGRYIMPYIKRKEFLVLILCVVMFLLSLPSITRGGIYYFTIIDRYSSAYSLMLIAFFEVVAICWVYGARQLAENVFEMLGIRPQLYFIVCWYVMSPLLIAIIMVFNFAEFTPVTYGDYEFPAWAHGIGWFLSSLSLVCLPLGAIKGMYNTDGKSVWQKFKSSLRPLVDTSYSFSDVHENAALENGRMGDDVHKPPAYELSVSSQKA